MNNITISEDSLIMFAGHIYKHLIIVKCNTSIQRI